MSDFNSSLPIRTEANADAVVAIADKTIISQTLAIDAAGKVGAKLSDGAGNAVTSSTAGAKQPLDVQLSDSSGNRYTTTNPLPVQLSEDMIGTEVNDYNTAAAVAAGATSNHDYTVTALKTLLLSQFAAAASGKMKIEVQVETGVASGVFTSKYVMFSSTANPSLDKILKNTISVAAGVRVRIIRTNLDKSPMDVYSTISGVEV